MLTNYLYYIYVLIIKISDNEKDEGSGDVYGPLVCVPFLYRVFMILTKDF